MHLFNPVLFHLFPMSNDIYDLYIYRNFRLILKSRRSEVNTKDLGDSDGAIVIWQEEGSNDEI